MLERKKKSEKYISESFTQLQANAAKNIKSTRNQNGQTYNRRFHPTEEFSFNYPNVIKSGNRHQVFVKLLNDGKNNIQTDILMLRSSFYS